MTVLWALTVVPTLIWWKDSILWVALMSVWANVASHFAAWQGAAARRSSPELLDHLPQVAG
jgi:hypothetical protein